MQDFVNLLLKSGKTGIDLAFYIWLPIMVVMMACMRYLEYKGVLARIAWFLTPILCFFGIPGIGIFAALQILFINFAAPVSTLMIIEKDRQMDKRRIAATLAMIIPMAQANAVFPLVTVGLNIPIVWLSSVLGGLIGASCTYYFFANKEKYKDVVEIEHKFEMKPKEKLGFFKIITQGGEEGVQTVLKAIPMLIFAILLVNILKEIGFIKFLNNQLSPVMGLVGVRGEAILPIVTKFFAGGTAMMGVTMDMVKDGTINALEINKIAGFMIHPFDLVGLAVYHTAGERVQSIFKPAIYGALIGILFRAVFHLIVF